MDDINRENERTQEPSKRSLLKYISLNLILTIPAVFFL